MEFHGRSKKEALVEVCRKLGPEADITGIRKVTLKNQKSYVVTASSPEEISPEAKKNNIVFKISLALISALMVVAAFISWPAISEYLFPEPVLTNLYEPTIAVMPFKNIGEEQGHPHFGEGLAEDIISGLINLKGLKIISKASTLEVGARNETISKIGEELGVATILKGTYRINGSKVKIVASLLDTADGSYIWTNSYNRQLNDVFLIQENISKEIIEAMRLELGLEDKRRYTGISTSNNNAMNSFHAGWHYIDQRTKESFAKAVESFSAAIKRDPQFARAYYGLGFAYYLQGSYNYVDPISSFRQGLEKVEAAIELNANLGEAYAIRAVIRRDLKLDWPGAEEDFKKAISLSPGSARAHHWYGNFLGDLGRFKEAEAQLLLAKELEPISRQINLDIAVAMIDRMEYDEALAQLKMTTEIFPEFRGAHHLYLVTLFRRGFLNEALEEYKRFHQGPQQSEASSELENIFYEKGFYAASREFLNKFGDTVGPHEKAALYMVLGDGEKAIEYLEEAFRIRSGRVFHLKSEPVFVPLHDHPRFIALVKKMNLD